MLGPGLITGVADDDPSGIATCSQTGAEFGYGQLWTALFMLPFMYFIQECCGRIGANKGYGLIHVIKNQYGYTIASFAVYLLLFANIINIGADIGSVVAATRLIVPVNFTVLMFFYLVLIYTSIVFMGYNKYAKLLKWLTLSILAYPITIILSNPSYLTILKSTFIPQFQFDYRYMFLLTGMFGTTISPYMFFWQASQEVEEDHHRKLISKNKNVRIRLRDFARIRFDTLTGMLASQFTTWSIIVVAAANFHEHNVKNVQSAEQAAKMLAPLVHGFPNAGFFAEVIFACGIIGLGLLSIPVLAGSASHALCELTNSKHGLNLKFRSAKLFYIIILVSFCLGLALNYIGINPMDALVYSAVVNGVLAVPLIALIALIGRNEKIMGSRKNSALSNFFIWLAFACMLVSALSMFAKFF